MPDGPWTKKDLDWPDASQSVRNFVANFAHFFLGLQVNFFEVVT